MKKIIIPDQEYLNSLLIYKDKFGSLHWKSQPGKRCNNTKDRAGCYNSKDYRVIRIDSKLYHEHRIIWVMQNGSIPEGYDIDHIDRNKVNNRINNLRLLNRSLNIINQNSKGVSYDKDRNKWKAQLTYKGKQIINKRFNTEEEALFAYQEAKNILFQTLNYSKDPGRP
jgi:hypothetical protein